MTVTSLVAVVPPRIGKIIKDGPSVFEREENLLQNGVLHFVFKLSQSSEIVLQNWLFWKFPVKFMIFNLIVYIW